MASTLNFITIEISTNINGKYMKIPKIEGAVLINLPNVLFSSLSKPKTHERKKKFALKGMCLNFSSQNKTKKKS